MKPEEKAKDLFEKFEDEIFMTDDVSPKTMALICVDEIILNLNSLFDLGLKDCHLVLRTPVRPYIDVINPLLKYWEEVKQEIEKL